MRDFVVVISTSNPLALCKFLVKIIINLKQMQLFHLLKNIRRNNLKVEKRERKRKGGREGVRERSLFLHKF